MFNNGTYCAISISVYNAWLLFTYLCIGANIVKTIFGGGGLNSIKYYNDTLFSTGAWIFYKFFRDKLPLSLFYLQFATYFVIYEYKEI